MWAILYVLPIAGEQTAVTNSFDVIKINVYHGGAEIGKILLMAEYEVYRYMHVSSFRKLKSYINILLFLKCTTIL
jgi:hypothetical protein